MKHKHTFLRRALSIVLCFAVVFPASLALIGNSGTAEAAGTKTSINVLSIEPSDTHILTAATVAGWGYSGTVNITYVSSLELNGCIEDLDENYDLIYIGDNNSDTTGLNLDSSLLYANIGAVTPTMPDSAVGLTDSEFSSTSLSSYPGYFDVYYPPLTTRYSGNDLTPVQLAALNKYADAGYPIIYGNGLTSGTVVRGNAEVYYTLSISYVTIGASATLTASVTANSGYTLPLSAPTYTWYKDGTSVTNINPDPSIFYATAIGTYYCTISYGKSNELAAKSNSLSIAVLASHTNISSTDASAEGSFDTTETGNFTVNPNTGSGAGQTPLITYTANTNNLTFYTNTTATPALPAGTTQAYSWYRQTYTNANVQYGVATSYTGGSSLTRSVTRPNNGYYYIFYCIETLSGSAVSTTPSVCRAYKVVRLASGNGYIVSLDTNTPYNQSTQGTYTYAFPHTFRPSIDTDSLTSTSNTHILTPKSNSSAGSATCTWYSTEAGFTGTAIGVPKTINSSAWLNNTSYDYYCTVTVSGSTSSSATKTNTITLTHVVDSLSVTTVIPSTLSQGHIPYLASQNFTINTATVDDCSNMFTFLHNNKDKPNVMRWNSSSPADIDSVALLNAINLSKPTISLSSSPTAYTGIGSTGALAAGATLSYTFAIANATDATPTTTSYYCYLSIDSNADGIFSLGERVSSLGNLMADTEYVVTYQLPSNLTGILPWQLKVIKTADESVHTSVSNYARVAASTRKTINILQINASAGLPLDNTGASFTPSTSRTAFLDLFTDVSNNSDYAIKIQTVTTAAINNISNVGITNGLIADSTSEKNITAFLNSYDMLLLGVGSTDTNYFDAYTIGDGITDYDLNEATVRAIAEFLKSKPVLFTHDTTSWMNLPYPYEATWNGHNYVYSYYPFYGYFIDTILRKPFGLDRYGITDDTYGHTIKSNPTLSASGLVARGYSGITSDDKDALTSAGYSIAYLPQSNKATTVATTQGFSNYIFTISHSSTTTTTTVSQVNEGQITCYPYNINTGIFSRTTGATATVYSTHSQCYQVNLNSTDTTVWYCLSSSAFNYNDVSNAAYIYKHGNATFSGFGNTITGITTSSPEAQLFVNTIIAAYCTSRVAPTVTFSDSTGVKSLNNYLMPSDSSGVLAITNSTNSDRYLYFKVTDTSGGNKKISASFSYGEEPSITAINTPTIYDSSNNIVDTATTSLVSDAIYHVKIDAVWANLLAEDSTFAQTIANGITLNIIATTTIGGSSPFSGTDTLKLRTFALFNLS